MRPCTILDAEAEIPTPSCHNPHCPLSKMRRLIRISRELVEAPDATEGFFLLAGQALKIAEKQIEGAC